MWVFLNGKIIEQEDASISPFDRGFQFSDGAYEVIRYYPEKFFELTAHLERLRYSLLELQIPFPPLGNIETQLNDLICRNNLIDVPSIAYIQITRGYQFPRKHSFNGIQAPTFFISVNDFPIKKDEMFNGVRAGLEKDIRWLRCDIKSTSLIPAVLSSRSASEKGFTEIIYHRDEIITEGAHTNVCFVKDNELVTPPLSNFILAGVTRKLVLGLCAKLNIKFTERDVYFAEVKNFDEIMILGTTTEITPVIEIEGTKINGGIPGPVCRLLQTEYQLLHSLQNNFSGIEL